MRDEEIFSPQNVSFTAFTISFDICTAKPGKTAKQLASLCICGTTQQRLQATASRSCNAVMPPSLLASCEIDTESRSCNAVMPPSVSYL